MTYNDVEQHTDEYSTFDFHFIMYE